MANTFKYNITLEHLKDPKGNDFTIIRASEPGIIYRLGAHIKELHQDGRSFLRYDGFLSIEDMQHIVDEFLNPEVIEIVEES